MFNLFVIDRSLHSFLLGVRLIKLDVDIKSEIDLVLKSEIDLEDPLKQEYPDMLVEVKRDNDPDAKSFFETIEIFGDSDDDDVQFVSETLEYTDYEYLEE